jgi:hypothetical protein
VLPAEFTRPDGDFAAWANQYYNADSAEVFVAVTAPDQRIPSDPREYRYIGSETRGETTLIFESDRGGMQAQFLSRWVSTSGAMGLWSDKGKREGGGLATDLDPRPACLHGLHTRVRHHRAAEVQQGQVL